MTVYKYHIEFQKLARYAKQDVPDDASRIYLFRNGLNPDWQYPPALHNPTKFSEFYNVAITQESAKIKFDASQKRFRDPNPASLSSQLF